MDCHLEPVGPSARLALLLAARRLLSQHQQLQLSHHIRTALAAKARTSGLSAAPLLCKHLLCPPAAAAMAARYSKAYRSKEGTASLARVYTDVCDTRPPSYSDYEALTVTVSFSACMLRVPTHAIIRCMFIKHCQGHVCKLHGELWGHGSIKCCDS